MSRAPNKRVQPKTEITGFGKKYNKAGQGCPMPAPSGTGLNRKGNVKYNEPAQGGGYQGRSTVEEKPSMKPNKDPHGSGGGNHGKMKY